MREPEKIPVRSRQVQSDLNSLCKIGLLPFIAMVINCTAQMERKSQKIELVAAADMFLGIRDFSAEELQGGWGRAQGEQPTTLMAWRRV